MKKLFIFSLILLVVLSGCSNVSMPDKDISKSDLAPIDPAGPMVKEETAITNFGVRCLQLLVENGENTLISPMSLLNALGMTANGASGETLKEMEAVFGLSKEELNEYLYYYRFYLPDSRDYKVNLANSIWIKDAEKLQFKDEFKQKNIDYYGADMFMAPFNYATKQTINKWVKEQTDGMIPEIIEEIPEDAVMYLINALSFDAKWEEEYDKHQVHDLFFTTEDGTDQKARMMFADENIYLEDEDATGFMKYYKDKKYAFVALLPDKGVKIADYVQSLTGERVKKLMDEATETKVKTKVPVFEYEYSLEMSDIFKSLGMEQAFDSETADFSALGTSDDGNIFISRILHKTYIELGQKGTKAAAATAVEMADGGAPPQENKEVYLDRPFVYMIVDTEHNLPLFIGALMSVE